MLLSKIKPWHKVALIGVATFALSACSDNDSSSNTPKKSPENPNESPNNPDKPITITRIGLNQAVLEATVEKDDATILKTLTAEDFTVNDKAMTAEQLGKITLTLDGANKNLFELANNALTFKAGANRYSCNNNNCVATVTAELSGKTATLTANVKVDPVTSLELSGISLPNSVVKNQTVEIAITTDNVKVNGQPATDADLSRITFSFDGNDKALFSIVDNKLVFNADKTSTACANNQCTGTVGASLQGVDSTAVALAVNTKIAPFSVKVSDLAVKGSHYFFMPGEAYCLNQTFADSPIPGSGANDQRLYNVACINQTGETPNYVTSNVNEADNTNVKNTRPALPLALLLVRDDGQTCIATDAQGNCDASVTALNATTAQREAYLNKYALTAEQLAALDVSIAGYADAINGEDITKPEAQKVQTYSLTTPPTLPLYVNKPLNPPKKYKTKRVRTSDVPIKQASDVKFIYMCDLINNKGLASDRDWYRKFTYFKDQTGKFSGISWNNYYNKYFIVNESGTPTPVTAKNEIKYLKIADQIVPVVYEGDDDKGDIKAADSCDNTRIVYVSAAYTKYKVINQDIVDAGGNSGVGDEKYITVTQKADIKILIPYDYRRPSSYFVEYKVDGDKENFLKLDKDGNYTYPGKDVVAIDEEAGNYDYQGIGSRFKVEMQTSNYFNDGEVLAKNIAHVNDQVTTKDKATYVADELKKIKDDIVVSDKYIYYALVGQAGLGDKGCTVSPENAALNDDSQVWNPNNLDPAPPANLSWANTIYQPYGDNTLYDKWSAMLQALDDWKNCKNNKALLALYLKNEFYEDTIKTRLQAKYDSLNTKHAYTAQQKLFKQRYGNSQQPMLVLDNLYPITPWRQSKERLNQYSPWGVGLHGIGQAKFTDAATSLNLKSSTEPNLFSPAELNGDRLTDTVYPLKISVQAPNGGIDINIGLVAVAQKPELKLAEGYPADSGRPLFDVIKSSTCGDFLVGGDCHLNDLSTLRQDLPAFNGTLTNELKVQATSIPTLLLQDKY